MNDPTRTSYGDLSSRAPAPVASLLVHRRKMGRHGPGAGAGRPLAALPGEMENVTVSSEAPGTKIREHYLVPGNDSFTYKLDVSADDGKTWTEGQIEMSFQRVE